MAGRFEGKAKGTIIERKSKGKGMTFLLTMVLLFSSFSMVLLISEQGSISAEDDADITVDGINYNIIPETYMVEVIAGDYSGEITIPVSITDEGTEYTVVSIGDNAFNGCTDLTAITIPSSVTTIGSRTFYNCIKLTSVDLSSVTMIGSYAFLGCIELTSVDLGSVITIEEYTFRDCFKLTKINLGSVITIGTGAFMSTQLTSVDLSSVTTIGDYAFYGCNGLKVVVLPYFTSFESDSFSDTLLLLNQNMDVVITATMNDGGDIEMTADAGEYTVIKIEITYTGGNYIATESEGKWMFSPAQDVREFQIRAFTNESASESSDGDTGKDGFWTTTNTFVVGIVAAAILGLLYVFVIRRP